MNKLLEAAKAVIARWDTPLWRDAPATAVFINELRAAVASMESQPTTWAPHGLDAATRAQPTKPMNCGTSHCSCIECVCDDEQEAPASDREALIARLAQQWAALDPADPYRDDAREAIDMLEVDARAAIANGERARSADKKEGV